ncbi:hypothetical protein Tco_1281821 [Tanacetum coccineum]
MRTMNLSVRTSVDHSNGRFIILMIPVLINKERSGYQQKDRKPSQNDKTEHGMEKTVQNQGKDQKSQSPNSIQKNQQSTGAELKNTIRSNLNPSDWPEKHNSILMKTVKTKWGPQS